MDEVLQGYDRSASLTASETSVELAADDASASASPAGGYAGGGRRHERRPTCQRRSRRSYEHAASQPHARSRCNGSASTADLQRRLELRARCGRGAASSDFLFADRRAPRFELDAHPCHTSSRSTTARSRPRASPPHGSWGSGKLATDSADLEHVRLPRRPALRPAPPRAYDAAAGSGLPTAPPAAGEVDDSGRERHVDHDLGGRERSPHAEISAQRMLTADARYAVPDRGPGMGSRRRRPHARHSARMFDAGPATVRLRRED